MSGVSNFPFRRDARAALEIRPVKRDEIHEALRLILTGGQGSAGDLAVVEFLQLSVFRGLDLTSIWVAADARERVVWAVLPMVNPGRCMALLVPPRLRPGVDDVVVAELCASACIEPRHQLVNFAQVLIDPAHKAVIRALGNSGFDFLADLVYLARDVRTRIPGRLFTDPTHRIWKYDRALHGRFIDVIERTYHDTLDCPKLNGKRHMEDVIAGHKGSGEFDPNLWYLISDIANHDMAVLLLNRLHKREGMEIVYLGVVPEARGKGFGDGLVRTAVNALAEEGGGHLLVSVDHANLPARRLYHRHGFGFLQTRTALTKSLTSATPQTKALITTTAMILRKQAIA